MNKEVKTYAGKINGISEVTETTKTGFFRFGVKAGKNWYGLSGNSDIVNAEHAKAQVAKDKRHAVEFDYTDDGRWLNITKVKSWKGEEKKEKKDDVLINKDLGDDSDRPEIPEPDKAREKKIAESQMANVEKEKKWHRLERIKHQTECLEDAVIAYRNVQALCATNGGKLDETDRRNIRAIANGFMAEDARKGRY